MICARAPKASLASRLATGATVYAVAKELGVEKHTVAKYRD
jgi:hypothetical protein